MASDEDSDVIPTQEAPADGVGSKIKQWISWSWKYLWGIWFLMIVGLLWTFRGPLRLRENINFGEYDESKNAVLQREGLVTTRHQDWKSNVNGKRLRE